MNITVGFKGALRELGRNAEWTGVKTIADIVSRVPGLKTDPINFIVTRNGAPCDMNTEPAEGDEILFYPMIMGG